MLTNTNTATVFAQGLLLPVRAFLGWFAALGALAPPSPVLTNTNTVTVLAQGFLLPVRTLLCNGLLDARHLADPKWVIESS